MTGKRIAFLEGSSPHTEDTVWFIEKTSAKDTSSPHTEDAALPKATPTRRGCHPAAIFQQSRAEVGPNSYARGDHVRPYCIGRRSLKRELLYNGKTNHIPGRTFPIRRGYRYYDRITCETVRRCDLSRAQEIPKVNVERQAHSPVKILIHLWRGYHPLVKENELRPRKGFSHMQGIPSRLRIARKNIAGFSRTQGIPQLRILEKSVRAVFPIHEEHHFVELVKQYANAVFSTYRICRR